MAPTAHSSRRQFLEEALSAGLLVAAGPALLFGQDTPPADPAPPPTPTTNPAFRKLRVALIGTGGIGGWHVEMCKDQGVQVPVICDVDTKMYEKALKLYPDARTYQDYREMLDREQKNFDAVMVGTPDHHHYPATILAMQLGKHVYTQKPLTHTVWESRQLLEAAQRYKVATQMGNQGHANEGWRLVYEWIRAGALGDVYEVHTWTDRPIWPQGMERPEGEDPVPDTLNWDVWLGPAPQRPFKKDAYHRFNWRGWWDFGAGALGDMACHTMDGMFWAMEPGHCTSVEVRASTPVNSESYPKASIVKWEFPATGNRAPFAGYWYDGGLLPTIPAELEMGRKLSASGNLFLGTKASLIIAGDYGESVRIYPESKLRAIGKPAQMLERSPGHFQEWLLAAIGEKPLDFPKSSFAYSAPMSETILLGNVALRFGRRLEWDGPNLRVTNLEAANRFLTREYRSGWKF